MAYEAYAASEDYEALFPDDGAPDDDGLETASRHIDAMTYGRITALGGLDSLTAFQRELVKEAVCRQTKFERENASLFSAAFASYAINGVSMKTGYAAGVSVHGGVAAPGEVTSLLDMTGLTDRTLRGTEP